MWLKVKENRKWKMENVKNINNKQQQQQNNLS